MTSTFAKVGLVYLSDYYYAYTAGGGTNCFSSSCTNWITLEWDHLWTMSRYGAYESYYRAWNIYPYGEDIISSNLAGTIGRFEIARGSQVSPVFYLLPSVGYKSGSGTSGDPFILE